MTYQKIIQAKYDLLKDHLNEKSRRIWAATEARMLGRGGITLISQATGLDPKVISLGLKELDGRTSEAKSLAPQNRTRRAGGGRKSLIEKDKTLLTDLENLIEPITRGDPQSPLRWTSKSTTKLAAALQTKGHKVSADTVGRLLRKMGYSLQSPNKSQEMTNKLSRFTQLEFAQFITNYPNSEKILQPLKRARPKGLISFNMTAIESVKNELEPNAFIELVKHTKNPFRNEQFEYINQQVKAFQARNEPTISIDTKKKEMVGNYDNGGSEWQKKGQPIKVNDHDFPDKILGKIIPYGVYDMAQNDGWVSVGITNDTATFAVNTIIQWWEKMGKIRYPQATELLINADGGGSNGSRLRLWKMELQRFCNESGLKVTVSHFPPGTSKWNKIEHRMFSQITENWRGRPLVSHETVVNLIANTTTQQGLKINAELDRAIYQKGVKDYEQISIQKDTFHGQWNYTIVPSIKIF